MTDILDQKPASTELTGGAGFTYEDTVVAYYLTHLLRHERGAGLSGVITGVAVQQRGQGNPMDDLVVEFDDASKARTLGLQIKRTVTTNDDEELTFYQSFTAFQLSGFEEGGALRIEIVNRLQEIVVENKDGADLCFSTGCAGLRAMVQQPANAGPALSCSNSSAAPLS